MRRKILWILFGICLILSACGTKPVPESSPAQTPAVTASASGPTAETPAAAPADVQTTSEEESMTLRLMIGDTAVAVDWEDNESVEALCELCREEPLTISLSMYGGFEQVGALGASLPRRDVQTTTTSGDIVLYAGDQIVVFYGSNSWAYTRLGHISDQSAADMKALLGSGDVSITLKAEGRG